jgi:hypothetical protein
MNKLCIASTIALCLAGTANAQVRPGEPIAGQAPTYAVDGLALGSKVRFESAAYRDYKCSPSEQFDGFTWCQRWRRDSERRGPFEATYSILHAKDGTVVYANRHQQPAFFDAGETDRDIQNYSRRFGETPRITRIPRRSGTSDAILATWGKVELEPLDNDSVRSLAEGKSPRKGLLVDFLGNFTRSAQEGLPIYRIVGGAGFVWAASFDQRGRGTLRFAAVDASGLTPIPVPNASVAQPVQPAPVPDASAAQPVQPAPLPVPDASVAQPVQPAPVQVPDVSVAKPTPVPTPPLPVPQSAARQSNDQQPSLDQAELAAAVRGRRDAEATVAQLQAELSTATAELSTAARARTEAELARTEAEKAARQARTDAEIARREFAAARDYANAAKAEIDRLMAAGGAPPSSVNIIVLLGIGATAILILVIWVLSRLRSALPSHPVDAGRADAASEERNDDAEGALVPLSAASESSEEKTEPSIDQDDLVKQLAKSLGVQDPLTPLPAEVSSDGDGGQPAIEAEQPEQAQAATSDAGGLETLPVDSPSSSPRQDELEASKSIVPHIPNAGEMEETKSVDRDSLAPQPEKAGPS